MAKSGYHRCSLSCFVVFDIVAAEKASRTRRRAEMMSRITIPCCLPKLLCPSRYCVSPRAYQADLIQKYVGWKGWLILPEYSIFASITVWTAWRMVRIRKMMMLTLCNAEAVFPWPLLLVAEMIPSATAAIMHSLKIRRFLMSTRRGWEGGRPSHKSSLDPQRSRLVLTQRRNN